MYRVRPYRRGGWEVDITVRLTTGEKFRERVRAPTLSKSGAQRWAQDREASILREGPRRAPQPTEAVPTLAEFQDRWLEEYAIANRQKPSAVASKRQILKHDLIPALGGKRLDEISESDVARLKAELAARVSAKTSNNILSVLSTMLSTAVEWGLIQRAPRVKMSKVATKQLEFYESEDLALLLDSAKKLCPQIYAMVTLGVDAGLREGEIAALEWPDVDFRRSQLYVNRSEWRGSVSLPKGGRPRTLLMTARLQSALAAIRHLRGPRVFWRAGGKVTSRTLVKWMARAQRRAGLTKITGGLHVLRHTFCSHLAMRGATAMAIQALAGHVSLSTTQRYMHLSPAHIDSAIRLLELGGSCGDILETDGTATENPANSQG